VLCGDTFFAWFCVETRAYQYGQWRPTPDHYIAGQDTPSPVTASSSGASHASGTSGRVAPRQQLDFQNSLKIAPIEALGKQEEAGTG
jgi:hypothetical protein